MVVFGDHKLNLVSKELRLDLLDLIYKAGGGHIGGSLSALDLMVAVYMGEVFDFKKDHFVLSAGHVAPALYVVLAKLGYIQKSELNNYSSLGSRLQGHVSTDVPGVEYSSGSLGQGLSFGCGLALGDKGSTVICLTSDGEQQEGQIWEAAMLAKKYKLGNLINLVDVNNYQIDGSTDEIMPLGRLGQKYIGFGWTVKNVNGHNFGQLTKALREAKNEEYPTCILARTILGKGISFMQYDWRYHDVKNLEEKLYLRAKEELEK